MAIERVILVDEQDRVLGTKEKLAAHETGQLHRAISVCVFRPSGQMLIQQRAHHKYHSPGLWSNTCCSHPRPGEAAEMAAHRRLKEELGFDCGLELAYTFMYRAEFENGLIEHEFDHVFVGTYEGDLVANPDEVADVRWMFPEEISQAVDENPDEFTVWFRIILPRLLDHLAQAVPGPLQDG